MSYTDALYRVSKGYDVFTYNGTFAYWLARAAGGGKIPVGPEIDTGKELLLDTIGIIIFMIDKIKHIFLFNMINK